MEYCESKAPNLYLAPTINEALDETRNKLYDALWVLMLRKCDINAYGYGGESIRRIYRDHKDGVSEYIRKQISDNVINRYLEVFSIKEDCKTKDT